MFIRPQITATKYPNIKVGVADLQIIPVCFHVGVIWLIVRGMLLIQASSFNLAFILFRGTFNRFHCTMIIITCKFYSLQLLLSLTLLQRKNAVYN